jgi:hypothetical protein
MPWDMDEEEFEEGELFEDDFDDWMPDNSIPEWQKFPDEESGEWQDMEDEWDDWEELAELEEFGVDDEEEDSADIEQANDTDYLLPGDEEEEQEGTGEEEPPDELDSFNGLADDDEEDEPSDSAISPGGPEEEERGQPQPDGPRPVLTLHAAAVAAGPPRSGARGEAAVQIHDALRGEALGSSEGRREHGEHDRGGRG